VDYRKSCLRGACGARHSWMRTPARTNQLQLEREERKRQQQLKQARIDRLLDEAASLRRAVDIRAYVEAVKTTIANEPTSISLDAIER
jgi:hypothetical protein